MKNIQEGYVTEDGFRVQYFWDNYLQWVWSTPPIAYYWEQNISRLSDVYRCTTFRIHLLDLTVGVAP